MAEFYNPHYIVGGYKPHVTVQKSGRAKRGDIIKVDNLSLVDMAPDGNQNRRRVIKTIKFNGR